MDIDIDSAFTKEQPEDENIPSIDDEEIPMGIMTYNGIYGTVTTLVGKAAGMGMAGLLGFFDYRGNKDSAEDSSIEGKRKRLLFASVGSMAGAGILGGPLGLLVGAVAGNALSVTGIGDKIKGLLFGKDHTDKNGKDKHKLGLVERAVNGVVDPIHLS